MHLVYLTLGHKNLNNDPNTLAATKFLLDYIYYAQYPGLSDSNITAMSRLLKDFHQQKNVFITQHFCKSSHLNIPKLHALLHIIGEIQRSGTTDNFSTEVLESLHIETCKQLYQASNKQDCDK